MKFLAFCLFLALIGASVISVCADCRINGHTFKKGETYAPIGECLQYTCHGKDQFSAKTCPAVATLKPCKFTQTDTTKPYPDCCPKHDC